MRKAFYCCGLLAFTALNLAASEDIEQAILAGSYPGIQWVPGQSLAIDHTRHPRLTALISTLEEAHASSAINYGTPPLVELGIVYDETVFAIDATEDVPGLIDQFAVLVMMLVTPPQTTGALCDVTCRLSRDQCVRALAESVFNCTLKHARPSNHRPTESKNCQEALNTEGAVCLGNYAHCISECRAPATPRQ